MSFCPESVVHFMLDNYQERSFGQQLKLFYWSSQNLNICNKVLQSLFFKVALNNRGVSKGFGFVQFDKEKNAQR